MTDHRENWIRATRQHPCPVCGKPDNCSTSRDRQMVWCGRVGEGSHRQNAGGQYLHRLNDAPWSSPEHGHYRPTKPIDAPPKDWKGIVERLARGCDVQRSRLACELGVSERALADLRVGWDQVNHYWSFPERDGDGKYIGLNRRFTNGSKKRSAGCKSGLTYADDWDTGEGPLLLVEGGSDTAALLTIGLSVVGRPSNLAGVNLLTTLLSGFSNEREIIVIGESDEKEDGRWPGKEGAISTAKQLAEQLARPIAWSLCPDNAKDARDWLRSIRALSVERKAALFVSGLETKVIPPPIVLSVQTNCGPQIPVDEWRAGMIEVRIASLNEPGYYLDASTTGAGKSHADLQVLKYAYRVEATP